MRTIGVITNPRARANLGNPRLHDTLADAVGSAGIVAAPNGTDALMKTLRDFQRSGVQLLAINGGDGTVHHVVTALVRAWEGPPPQLAFLPGGTMNIVASSVGVRGRPQRVLSRLVDAPDLTTRHVWAMEITGDGPPVYGFLFGNGIVARFLEVYYEGSDPSPSKAAWILARGAMSALVGGSYIRRLTRPFQGTLRADGEDLEGHAWTAIAAGTVEQLGLGFRAFHLVTGAPGRMHLQAVGGSVVDLARDLPRIYRGLAPTRPGNRELTATELQIRSPERIGYMVDGDFYTASQLDVRVGPCFEAVIP